MSEQVRTSLIVAALAAVCTALILSLPYGVITASILAFVFCFVVVYLRATRRIALFTAVGLASGLGIARAVPAVTASFRKGEDVSLGLIVGDTSSAGEWPVIMAIGLLLLYEALPMLLEKLHSGDRARKPLQFSVNRLWQFGSATRSAQVVVRDVSNTTINIGNDFNGFSECDAARAVQGIDSAHFATPTATGSANAEIDSIVAYMKEGRQNIAHELFLKLKRHRFDSLTSRERFRVIANLGHCSLALDRPHDASKYFREAKDYQPEDEYALALEAFGYSLISEGETALRLAEAVIAKYPTCAKAVTIRIQHLPPGVPFAEIVAGIDPAVRQDGEVLYSLGRRAQTEGLYDEAVKYLREALSRTEGDAAVRADLAAFIVDRVYRDRPDKFRPPRVSGTDESLVREAVNLLSGLISESDAVPIRAGLARFRYNRGMALVALGENTAACDDFRVACDLAPDDPTFVISSALHLHEEGDRNGAINLLLRLLDRRFDATATRVAAHWLVGRGKLDDKALALARLSIARDHLPDIPTKCRLDIFLPYLTLLTEAGRSEDAGLFLDSAEAKDFTPIQTATLRAHLALLCGNESEAKDHAHTAATLLDMEFDYTAAESVAEILTKLGDFADAFSVWNRVVEPTEATYRTEELCRCAKEAGEDQFLLERCETLREAGHYAEYFLQLEVSTLLHYDAIPKALCVIADGIAHKPASRLARILRFHRSSIGYLTGRSDLIECDRSMMPTVEEVDSKNLPSFAVVYCEGPGRHAAAEMLYSYIRQHPRDINGLKAYVFSVGLGDATEEFATPDEAGPGAAICYLENGKDEQIWHIIEDAADPDPDRHEFPPTHRLSLELIGKKPGDQFTLQEDEFAKRAGKVLSIIDKYAYRRNVIRETWSDRFPEEFFIKKMEMPTRPDGTMDFAPLLAHLDRQHEELQAVQNIYREHPLPIVALARRTNVSLADALFHVSASDDLPVRCCHGNPEELRQAFEAIDGASQVVLEPLAAATLFITATYRRLSEMPFELVVTEGTVQEFRARLVTDTRRPGETGRIGKTVRGYFTFEWQAEQIEADRTAIRDFLEWLTTRCTVVDGLSLAAVKSDVRHRLEGLFGAGSAQSIAHAAVTGIPMWCDDLAIAEVSREWLSTRRAWTAVFADMLAGRGVITDEERTAIFTDLVSRGYWFTPMTPDVFLLACNRAEWIPDRSPLNRACRWFAEPSVNPKGLTQVFAACLQKVRRSAVLEHQCDEVTNALCAHVARHPSGRTILKVAADNIKDLFGVDVLGAGRCEAMLRRWAASDGGGIKIVE